MSLSGIMVTDEVMQKYDQIFVKKSLKWVKFHISDDMTKVVHDDAKEKKVDPAAKKRCEDGETTDQESWDELVAGLTDEVPEYILFDFYAKYDGRKVEKCILLNWCSDNCVMRLKMVHASTYNTVKGKFNNVQKCIQANDKGDLVFKDIMEKVLST